MLARRQVFLGLAALGLLPAGRASAALEIEAARAHVSETIEAILRLIVANRPRAETAKALREIIERRSALPQLARYVSGRHWEGMSGDQRGRFTETLGLYIAHVYAGYFRAYEGKIENLRNHVAILSAEDAGRKGVLVKSEIRPVGQVAVPVHWLISDRSGRVAVSDLVVAGISMARTQREVIQAMFERRGGDAERMIAELRTEAARSIEGLASTE